MFHMVPSFPLILGVYESCVTLLFPKIFFYFFVMWYGLKLGRFLFGSFVLHDTLDIFQKFWLPTINALFWKAKKNPTEMRRYWIAKWCRFSTWMVVLCKCSHIQTHTYFVPPFTELLSVCSMPMWVSIQY